MHLHKLYITLLIYLDLFNTLLFWLIDLGNVWSIMQLKNSIQCYLINVEQRITNKAEWKAPPITSSTNRQYKSQYIIHSAWPHSHAACEINTFPSVHFCTNDACTFTTWFPVNINIKKSSVFSHCLLWVTYSSTWHHKLI